VLAAASSPGALAVVVTKARGHLLVSARLGRLRHAGRARREPLARGAGQPRPRDAFTRCRAWQARGPDVPQPRIWAGPDGNRSFQSWPERALSRRWPGITSTAHHGDTGRTPLPVSLKALSGPHARL